MQWPLVVCLRTPLHQQNLASAHRSASTPQQDAQGPCTGCFRMQVFWVRPNWTRLEAQDTACTWLKKIHSSTGQWANACLLSHVMGQAAMPSQNFLKSFCASLLNILSRCSRSWFPHHQYQHLGCPSCTRSWTSQTSHPESLATDKLVDMAIIASANVDGKASND